MLRLPDCFSRLLPCWSFLRPYGSHHLRPLGETPSLCCFATMFVGHSASFRWVSLSHYQHRRGSAHGRHSSVHHCKADVFETIASRRLIRWAILADGASACCPGGAHSYGMGMKRYASAHRSAPCTWGTISRERLVKDLDVMMKSV